MGVAAVAIIEGGDLTSRAASSEPIVAIGAGSETCEKVGGSGSDVMVRTNEKGPGTLCVPGPPMATKCVCGI